MRTNIEIDDELMARAMEAAGLTTKRATVEEGLRLLIRRNEQQAVRRPRGKVAWEGDLDAWRRDP
jgi:Arc/MetJ family transcription regulator